MAGRLWLRFVFPGIDDSQTDTGEVPGVARDQRHAVLQGGCGDDEIGLSEGAARFSAFLNQLPPPKHHVLSQLQDTTGEHGPNLDCEPLFQFIAAYRFGQELDPESNFREGDRTDIELIGRMSR